MFSVLGRLYPGEMRYPISMQRVIGLILLSLCLSATLHAGEGPNIAIVLDETPPPSTALGEVIAVEAEPVVSETPDLPRASVTASEVPQQGAWLVLDGSLSSDPLRGELKYQWKQSGGPRLPFLPEELTKPQVWVYLAFAGQYRFAHLVCELCLSCTQDATE